MMEVYHAYLYPSGLPKCPKAIPTSFIALLPFHNSTVKSDLFFVASFVHPVAQEGNFFLLVFWIYFLSEAQFL